MQRIAHPQDEREAPFAADCRSDVDKARLQDVLAEKGRVSEAPAAGLPCSSGVRCLAPARLRRCWPAEIDPCHNAQRPPQTELRKRIQETAGTRVRYGDRRIHVLLRREGWEVNAKRVYQLYVWKGLQIRTRRPKRNVAATPRLDRKPPIAPNDVRAKDFLSDCPKPTCPACGPVARSSCRTPHRAGPSQRPFRDTGWSGRADPVRGGRPDDRCRRMHQRAQAGVVPHLCQRGCVSLEPVGWCSRPLAPKPASALAACAGVQRQSR
ncbi:MAG: transposase [Rhodobacteraceae bacterium]|nr:transposase [Paracoccaceae bacterium]